MPVSFERLPGSFFGRWPWGLMLMLAWAVRAAAFDITFVQVSDTHYLADASANTAQSNLVNKLNNLPGKSYPDGSGVVGTPLGVIHSGDIIDAGSGGNTTRTNEWLNFTAHFGLTGKDGLLKYPVYEGYGNHDQDSWQPYVAQLIRARNANRPYVVNTDSTSPRPHYSWNWGPVHFIQLNIRCGGTERYNAYNSYSFLTNDLAQFVGNSGRPVIIVHHLAPAASSTDWPQADLDAFASAIAGYNVIAIIYGHTHAYGAGKWNGVRIINCDDMASTGGTFLVYHITDTQLRVYQRSYGGSWGGTINDAITVPAAPRITGAVLRPDHSMDLQLTGDAGRPCKVQYSTDLMNWTTLSTTNIPYSPFQLIDPSATSGATRFYRAILGP